jgi:hypothetical protein
MCVWQLDSQRDSDTRHGSLQLLSLHISAAWTPGYG